MSAMAAAKDSKRGGKQPRRQRKSRKQVKPSGPSGKSATRPSDVYEAEQHDPQEELKAGQRYDVGCLPCLPMQQVCKRSTDKVTVSAIARGQL